jgi:hypothetical protein
LETLLPPPSCPCGLLFLMRVETKKDKKNTYEKKLQSEPVFDTFGVILGYYKSYSLKRLPVTLIR